jgi:hypothetical protein
VQVSCAAATIGAARAAGRDAVARNRSPCGKRIGSASRASLANLGTSPCDTVFLRHQRAFLLVLA